MRMLQKRQKQNIQDDAVGDGAGCRDFGSRAKIFPMLQLRRLSVHDAGVEEESKYEFYV